jgi:hypothetical protein
MGMLFDNYSMAGVAESSSRKTCYTLPTSYFWKIGIFRLDILYDFACGNKPKTFKSGRTMKLRLNPLLAGLQHDHLGTQYGYVGRVQRPCSMPCVTEGGT